MKKVFAALAVATLSVDLSICMRVFESITTGVGKVLMVGVYLANSVLVGYALAKLFREINHSLRTLREKSAVRNGMAHFQLCDCGKHGRVVFPDGRMGGEIASKEEADWSLQYAALVGDFQVVRIFSNYELGCLQAEIRASSLPTSTKEVSENFRMVLDTWNWGKLHQPKLDPVDFHKVQERLWSYRAD